MGEWDGSWVGPVDNPDEYRLIEVLGGGGEGIVWKAESRLSGAIAYSAIKISDYIGTADEVKHWEHQHKFLTDINHPNLVRVKTTFPGAEKHLHSRLSGTDPSEAATTWKWYTVMSFEEGDTFNEWLGSAADPSVGERLRKMHSIATALDMLHQGSAGWSTPVAHGDVKALNIVVRKSDQSPVLVDLGLSRLAQSTGKQGLSLPYAAPELRKDGTSPDADRFAFIMTVCHSLSGEAPPINSDRSGPDLVALREQLLATPRLSGREALVDLIMSAAEGTRPPTLSTWLSSLTGILSQVTTKHIEKKATTQPTPPVPPQPRPRPDTSTRPAPLRPKPPRRRHRGRWVGAVLLACVIGGTAWAQSTGAVDLSAARDWAHRLTESDESEPPASPTAKDTDTPTSKATPPATRESEPSYTPQPASPDIDLSGGSTTIDIGGSVALTYELSHSLPGGWSLSLQRRMGTSGGWGDVKTLDSGSRSTSFSPSNLGTFKVRVAAKDRAGSVQSASAPKIVTVYGRVPLAKLLSGRAAQSVSIGSRTFTYYLRPNIASAFYDPVEGNPYFGYTSSPCRSIHLDIAVSDSAAAFTTAAPNSFEVRQESQDAVKVDTPPGTVQSLEVQLVPGQSWKAWFSGNHYLYVNGYAICSAVKQLEFPD